LRNLAGDFAALHPDFARAVAERATDEQPLRDLLVDFECGYVWSDDERARDAAAKLSNKLCGFRMVFDEILAAARKGYYGCWSF